MRGDSCTAARFEAGSGVTKPADGRLVGGSVNAGAGVDLPALTAVIPNGRVGVTRVGAVRAAGGEVTPMATSRNPLHCVMDGLTAQQAEALFTPTAPNPHLED